MGNNTQHLTVGVQGELIAQEYLTDSGYQIYGVNIHNRGGEIDIVAIKERQWYFVEVKTSSGFCTKTGRKPVDNITRSKIIKLHRAIEIFNKTHNKQHYLWQLDAVLVYLNKYQSKPSVQHLEHISIDW